MHRLSKKVPKNKSYILAYRCFQCESPLVSLTNKLTDCSLVVTWESDLTTGERIAGRGSQVRVTSPSFSRADRFPAVYSLVYPLPLHSSPFRTHTIPQRVSEELSTTRHGGDYLAEGRAHTQ